MNESEYKNCPYCDETIRQRAVKCRYCQSNLVEETSPEIYDLSQDSADDHSRVTVEAKCPKCNAFCFSASVILLSGFGNASIIQVAG